MRRPTSRRLSPDETRRFISLVIALTLCIMSIYWIGWRSTWARNKKEVRVIPLDIPREEAHPPVLIQKPVPPVSSPAQPRAPASGE